MRLFLKYLFLFLIGGVLYFFIEVAWRGYSHWTMMVLGGICFLYAGIQNEFSGWDAHFWKQVLKVDALVLILEFLSGCILNLYFHLHIWDYSDLPFNILGQSCPQFGLLFLPLCAVAILLDDYIRYWIFDEEKPRYKWF